LPEELLDAIGYSAKWLNNRLIDLFKKIFLKNNSVIWCHMSSTSFNQNIENQKNKLILILKIFAVIRFQ